eukprot:63613_1
MANKQSTANGKLKIQPYPVDISEYDWIPTDYNDQEALITHKQDRRIRAHPNDYNDFDEKQVNNPIYNIVQLRMKYENCNKVGSGVVIHHTLNKAYVLTAAHNIIDTDGDYAQSIWIQINKNTSNGHDTLKQYACCEYHVHPKYIEFQETFGSNVSDTGYDIGIIEVWDPQNKLKQIKPVKIRSIESKALNNMRIKVVGFPGFPQQEKKRGELYGMMGDGNIGYVNDNIKYKELMTYDIDTTCGQSGSPVFSVDEKDDNVYGSFTGRIVAIHVSGKKKKKLNFATILDDEILGWINQWICNGTHVKKWTTDMLIKWINNLPDLSDVWKQQLIEPIQENEITGDDICGFTGENLSSSLDSKNRIACKRIMKNFNDLKKKQNEQKINNAILMNSLNYMDENDDEKGDKKFKLQLNAEGKYIELDEWVTLETTLIECKKWYKEQRGAKSELNDIDFYYLGKLMDTHDKTLGEYSLNEENHVIS